VGEGLSIKWATSAARAGETHKGAESGRGEGDFFRQMAAQYRQLGEIASNAEIKQRMLDMAAHYQAKADEDKDAEQRSGEGATRARA
jgi:hypothetical protein